MVNPLEPFKQVLCTDSSDLINGLQTEREDILSSVVNQTLNNEGLSHIKYEDVNFDINVSAKESVESVANEYYEHNDTSTIPNEYEVINFVLSYPELLNIDIMIHE